MATIGYANLPVPAGGDGPTVPAAVAALAAALDPHLVQYATDQADRDAKFADAPAQTFVIALDGSVWIKTSSSANTWFTAAAPEPPWSALTIATGFTVYNDPPQYKIIGTRVWLRGSVMPSSGGNIPLAGVQIASVPGSAIPQQVGRIGGTASLTGDASTGTGRVEVLGFNNGSSNGPGAVMWYSQDGSGVPWCDISGSYAID